MGKHTPGPWEVRPVERDPNAWDVYTVGGGKIAHLPWQRLADAHLIAAAPELLAAAKLTALHFERSKASGNFQGDDEHEAWTALSKAIAKAEGTALPVVIEEARSYKGFVPLGDFLRGKGK